MASITKLHERLAKNRLKRPAKPHQGPQEVARRLKQFKKKAENGKD